MIDMNDYAHKVCGIKPERVAAILTLQTGEEIKFKSKENLKKFYANFNCTLKHVFKVKEFKDGEGPLWIG